MKPEHIKKKTVFLSIGLIIVLGFAVYGNSLKGNFFWDDKYLVENNTYIRDYSNVAKIFTHDIASGAGIEFTSYRPLQMLTYMADYSLWKLNAKGYHLTNILLHISAALCVWWLISILYGDYLLSSFCGMLFITHPIHTGAISYISGRADALAAVFVLLCFIFYIKHINSGNAVVYILMLSSYALALLSRENSLILPAILLLYHYAFKKKFKINAFLPVLAVTITYILIRLLVLETPMPHVLRDTSLFQRLPGFFAAITNYVRLLFLPINLHMEYGDKFFKFENPQVISGIVIFFSLMIYALRKRNSNTLIFFSISWFFITLLPQSNLYPIDSYMAEHWLYLPSIGFFLIFANAFSHFYRTEKFKVFGITFFIALTCFYSYLTVKQNSYWNNPVSYYENSLKYAPDSWRMHNNLGNLYMENGNQKKAAAAYKKALSIRPDYAQAYYNLGNLYKNMGDTQEATASYKKAIKINPYFVRAYNNLAVLCNATGKSAEAITLCQKALEINPDDAYVHNNLAIAYYNENQYDLAVKHYDKAVKLGCKSDGKFLKCLEARMKR